MKYQHPLKQILSQTRSYWDQDNTRPAVRAGFTKALQCRTAVLGAEIYGSENQERIVFHTCKSRPCSSCGYRGCGSQWEPGAESESSVHADLMDIGLRERRTIKEIPPSKEKTPSRRVN